MKGIVDNKDKLPFVSWEASLATNGDLPFRLALVPRQFDIMLLVTASPTPRHFSKTILALKAANELGEHWPVL